MECAICFEEKLRKEMTFLNCKHHFCSNCMELYKRRKNKNCPICRADIKNDLKPFKSLKEIDDGELSESDIDSYMCI
jgi:hypothetical protein